MNEAVYHISSDIIDLACEPSEDDAPYLTDESLALWPNIRDQCMFWAVTMCIREPELYESHRKNGSSMVTIIDDAKKRYPDHPAGCFARPLRKAL